MTMEWYCDLLLKSHKSQPSDVLKKAETLATFSRLFEDLMKERERGENETDK